MATTTHHNPLSWELEDLLSPLTQLPDTWHIITGNGWLEHQPDTPSIVLLHRRHGLVVLWPAYHGLTYRNEAGRIVASQQPDPTRPYEPLPYDPFNLTRTIAYNLRRQLTKHTDWQPATGWGITSPYYQLRAPQLTLSQLATISPHQLIDVDVLHQPHQLENELAALTRHCNTPSPNPTPATPDQWDAAREHALPATINHTTRLLTTSRRMRKPQREHALEHLQQRCFTTTHTTAAWTGDPTTARLIAASEKTRQLRAAGHRTLLLTPTWHNTHAHLQENPDNQPRTLAGLAYQALTGHGEDGSADQAADHAAHRPTRTGYNPPTLLTWTLEHVPFAHHSSWGDLLHTHHPTGPHWQWDAIVIDHTQHLDPDTLAYLTLLTNPDTPHLYLFGDPHHPHPYTHTCTPPPWDNHHPHTLTTANPPLHHPHLTTLAHQIHPDRTPAPTTPDTTPPQHTLLPAPTPPELPTNPPQRTDHRNRYRNTLHNRLDDTIEQLINTGIRLDELTLLCDNLHTWEPILYHHHNDGHPRRHPHQPATTHPHLHTTTPYYTYTRTTPHTHLPILTTATAPDANPHTTLILLSDGSPTLHHHLPHQPATRRHHTRPHHWQHTAHTLITATRTTGHLLLPPDHPLTPTLTSTNHQPAR